MVFKEIIAGGGGKKTVPSRFTEDSGWPSAVARLPPSFRLWPTRWRTGRRDKQMGTDEQRPMTGCALTFSLASGFCGNTGCYPWTMRQRTKLAPYCLQNSPEKLFSKHLRKMLYLRIHFLYKGIPFFVVHSCKGEGF
jgi:hypothetical protein